MIRAIHEDYEGQIVFPCGTEILQTTSTDYLFCAGALQIPKEISGTKDEATYKTDAEDERSLFFDAPELVSYLRRIRQ